MNDTWLNRGDITYAKETLARHPVLSKAANLLDAYKELIDSISDGWSSWSYGTKCAGDLCIIVGNASHALMYRDNPDSKAIDKACQKIVTFLRRCKQTKNNPKVIEFLENYGGRVSLAAFIPPPDPVVSRKTFKVASVSENTNSFGLKGHVLIARDGEAWQAGKTLQFAHKKGDEVVIECRDGTMEWGRASFEIPNKLGIAPQGVIDEIWK